jgi:hypothetical protein
MKKIHFLKYAVLAFSLVLFQFCRQNSEPDSLSVSPSSLSFKADETGEQSVAIATTASSWDATADADWIKLNKADNTLKVSVAANAGSARDATITLTAGDADPVIVLVTQAEIPVTIYTHAEGKYYGDAANKGTAFYTLDLYDSDTNVGLFISAFCTLPSGFDNFKLTTGIYTLEESGVVKTFIPGRVTSETSVGGTIVYNFNTKKFIRITGGTFTVEASGSNYTITTQFTGIDHSTGTAVSNIRATYSGTIPFTCEDGCNSGCTPPFGSFCESNFTATGSPFVSSSPGSWTGVISPKSTSNGTYYQISKWGTYTNSVFCDYKNGKITIDNYTKLFTQEGLEYSFGAVAINQAQGTGEILSSWEVKYNASTKTLDFSGSYSGNPVFVGYVASSGTKISIIHGYSNLKFVLSSISSAPMLTQGIDAASKVSSDVNNKENILKQNVLRTDGALSITLKKASLSE